jgi:1,4-dihydroxy-2-naphthoate octaprenyltransferase
MYRLPFRHGPRRVAFLFGTFASLAWMGLVSFAISWFWISPTIPWTMVVATISLSSWLIDRLQNASSSVDQAHWQPAAEMGSMVTTV